MMWHMTHRDPKTKELYSPDDALAKASAREKQMTEAELRYARGWALAGLRFAELCKECWGVCRVKQGGGGSHWAALSGGNRPGCTLGELLEESGLQAFVSGVGRPESPED
jgi:hypothetical protein